MRKLRHEEISRPSMDEAKLLPKHPVTVVLDDVRSVYNVGAIFRTSDAVRIERVLITGITATPDNRSLHKTALGAQDSVPWRYMATAGEAASTLKSGGYTICALELTDAPTLTTRLPHSAFPVALVVGNELTGVSDPVLKQADYALEIPQYGIKQSLNVAVAFGIAVYDLVRIWRKHSQP